MTVTMSSEDSAKSRASEVNFRLISASIKCYIAQYTKNIVVLNKTFFISY